MKHVVKRGETLNIIARRYADNGIKNWQEIYNDRSNAAFRLKNRNPNSIQPGAIINIPLVNLNIKNSKNGVTKTCLLTSGACDKLIDKNLSNYKTKTLPKVKLQLEKARTAYDVLKDLIDSNTFISWVANISDGGGNMPSDAALKKAERVSREIEMAIRQGSLSQVEKKIKELEAASKEASTIYENAIKGLGGGAGNAVIGLEITKEVSFAVVEAGIVSMSVGSGAIISRGAALGYKAAVSMVQTAANESGKAIAGSSSQTALSASKNILQSGLTTLVLGKIFGKASSKEKIGKLADKISKQLTSDKLNKILKTNNIVLKSGKFKLTTSKCKTLLEDYMTNAGKSALKSVIEDGIKVTNGKLKSEELFKRMEKAPINGAKGTFYDGFAKWLVEKAVAPSLK